MQIIMKILILTMLLIGIFCVFRVKEKYKLVLNEFFWLFASWIVCLVLYFFSGIKYTFNLTFLSLGYIFLTLMLFLLGHKISRFCHFKFIDKLKIKKENKKINFFPLFIVSLISVILYILYIIINNNIIFGVTRDIDTNAITTILLFMSSSSLIIWLYELSYALFNEKRISYYGIISAIIYNAPGLIISGRDALIIFLVATFIVFVYCGNYAVRELKKAGVMVKKILKYSLIITLIIIIYLIFLSNNRYGEDKNDALNMFEWSAGCEFPSYLKSINKNISGVGNLINNAVFYYSSQISKYAFVFDNYEGPHLFGFYQLHYVSRRFPDNSKLKYNLVSEKLEDLTSEAGIPGLKVMWETALGYSIYDFGRIGTLIVSFIGGFIVGVISKLCDKAINMLTILVKTFICVAMFLTVQISPIFDYFYVFPLVWLIFIIVFKRGLYEKKG